ncbi:MAG: hypothetical protein AABW91_04290 [Nanoarchaeota archaeon]
MIIFLIGFLSNNSHKYISRSNLELAIQDLIDESELCEADKVNIKRIYGTNPEALLRADNKYIKNLKPYLVPFIN